MTYCIGIKTNDGLVFASDSRTNAGLDNVNIYSKMMTHDVGDRTIVIVTSGNLGTSQAVFKSIEKDLKSSSGIMNLNTCSDFEQIASYVGSLNMACYLQDEYNYLEDKLNIIEVFDFLFDHRQ